MTIFPDTALELGQAIAQGELNPVDITEHCLGLAQHSDSVFISLTEERALREARASAARQQSGARHGPLDGVPIAWKDLFDITGTCTTAGSRVLSASPAQQDANAVRHLSGAGMVCIGKTNLTELAYSGLGLNPHYGTPHCTPGDGPTRAPGGSSSGSAIAVAQRIVPAAIGTDTAGSLRVPAAFNGLCAYRPSQQRHDRIGTTPLARSLDTIGVIARTLDDCVAIDDAMRGHATRQRTPSQPNTSLLIVDTAILEDQRLEPSVRDHLLHRAKQLREAGFMVVERPLQSIADTLDDIHRIGWLGAAEAYTEYRALLESNAAHEMDPRVRQRLLNTCQMPPDAVVTLYRRRQELIEQLSKELGGAVLLTPTVAHIAPELAPLEQDAELFAEVNLATLRLSMVASLLDCPAVALPCGRHNQQHTSMQLSASRGQDEALLRTALAVDQCLTAFPTPTTS
ncbi:amidase family protein [Halomonas binhaiensis]|uniref:Amidase domain-containing protein n=1 Tax=Halomonas binhaiensis TaxID=2562282 RepID=A0A5C1NG99_9GAMM|nr:amidase family protein [Halomonas binhaiensis]QEM81267.1 hypothetical protein E4T21_06765 [Halomonas binhaiensis]